MTDLLARNRVRLRFVLAIIACFLVFSLVALSQTVWAQEPVDVGDAPTSWNNFGLVMTMYYGGAVANYPVVAFPPAPPSPDGYGFCHAFPSASWLGPAISPETEADIGPDPDIFNNIIPPANWSNFDGFDDGVVFPPSMASCHASSIQVQGQSVVASYINVWADWNRDGDWNDGSVCSCGDNEWAVQNVPVGGSFSQRLTLMPCNPVANTGPTWFRVTLSPLPLPLSPDREWSAGGKPPSMATFCFPEGETEDYYVELQEPACEWLKEVSINSGPFLPPEAGPFAVVLSDTATISESLWCNFDFGWTLTESWDPDVFSVVYSDTSHGTVTSSDGSLLWSGGYQLYGTPITMTKTLHADGGAWQTSVITEEADLGPLHFDGPPIEFVEMAEGGDAPSSHNHGLGTGNPNLPMLTHPGGALANFPVVWDFDGSLGPGPATGYYGFCHWASESPSYLGPPAGPGKSYELDADLLPDQDGKTNINPLVGTPDWDGHDNGILTWPADLPQGVPATFQVQVNNNSGSILYLNGWADWNRDGDWEDGSVCGGGDDEWAVQDIAVPPGYQVLPVEVTPCHPGLVPGESFESFWMRFTLSPDQLGTKGPPFTYGGSSLAAGNGGCFEDGETEDYFVEGYPCSACQWEKEVSINSGPFLPPDAGPFGVVFSDTVTISESLSCNFDFAWDLKESWDPGVFSLNSGAVTHGTLVVHDDSINWVGYPEESGTVIRMAKTLRVNGTAWQTSVITEEVDFSPLGMQFVAPPIEFVEMAEGGDAPSSHNHGLGTGNPNLPMLTHPGGALANFPVVWDFDGSLGPSPATGYYGFCHWAGENPSYLGPLAGPGKTYELDADLLPDQDGKTNINPPAGTPDWDGHDDGILTWPLGLPQCGPADIEVGVNNNSGGILYLNGWADWNRDGDWEDGSVCGCGDDEWAVQDAALASGSYTETVRVTPCHPNLVPGAPIEPFWVRLTLSPYELGAKGPPFTYGGFSSAGGDSGCFQDGETEDYFIEGSLLDVCLWEKEVTIDGQGPYAPEEGPFTISVGSTILITDSLWCNFDDDWDLWESWDESGIHMTNYIESHGSAAWALGTFHWWSAPIPGNPLVQAEKRFHVWGFPALPEPLVITETVDFSPEGIMPTWERPVVLQPHEAYVPLALKRY